MKKMKKIDSSKRVIYKYKSLALKQQKYQYKYIKKERKRELPQLVIKFKIDKKEFV